MMSALKRDLGLLDVFYIASGAMISSGLFIISSMVLHPGVGIFFLSY